VDRGTAAGGGVLRLRGRSFGPGQLVIMARAGLTPGARGSDLGSAWGSAWGSDLGSAWGSDLGSARSSARSSAAAMDRVHAVVAEGADIVDLGGGPAGPGTLGGGPAGPGTELTAAEEIRRAVPFVAAVRAAYPDLVIGVGAWRLETARELCAAGADLLRDYDERLSEVAGEYGAGVVCGDADRAVARGVEPARVLVDAGTGAWPWPETSRRLEEMVAAGWPILVSVPGASPDAGRAGGLAAAAVWAWLGARVFRAHQVTQTRRVVTMVAAIRGDRPPARAVRGLA
jgi:dihydropteroate synthase